MVYTFERKNVWIHSNLYAENSIAWENMYLTSNISVRPDSVFVEIDFAPYFIENLKTVYTSNHSGVITSPIVEIAGHEYCPNVTANISLSMPSGYQVMISFDYIVLIDRIRIDFVEHEREDESWYYRWIVPGSAEIQSQFPLIRPHNITLIAACVQGTMLEKGFEKFKGLFLFYHHISMKIMKGGGGGGGYAIDVIVFAFSECFWL